MWHEAILPGREELSTAASGGQDGRPGAATNGRRKADNRRGAKEEGEKKKA